jgi:hypothetical protein
MSWNKKEIIKGEQERILISSINKIFVYMHINDEKLRDCTFHHAAALRFTPM